MDEFIKLSENFVHLARIALSGREQDAHTFLYRLAKRKSLDPKLAEALIELLREKPTAASPLRRLTDQAIPVDSDTRFHLLSIEEHPELPHQPIYSPKIQKLLERLIAERSRLKNLIESGLEPTKSILFTGPPGVGKTLAAKWLALELQRPLLTLDLSAVMSSYLGRTGTNLKQVLDYAKSIDCVLLLDELDAIAKRRGDQGEIGELKRLVTVLLQQLDDWPSSGLLVGATNHDELLDPALWRRFEEQVEFDLPGRDAAVMFIAGLLSREVTETSSWSEVLAIAMQGLSFSDIERSVNSARRLTAIGSGCIEQNLTSLVQERGQSAQDKIELAAKLVAFKLVSQRRARELTGVARDTIRKYVRQMSDKQSR